MTALFDQAIFDAAQVHARRGGQTALAARRDVLADRFKLLGLPTRKVESYHWTDLRVLADRKFVPVAPQINPPMDLGGHYLCIRDGVPAGQIAASGLRVDPWGQADLGVQAALKDVYGHPADTSGAMGALNTALSENGVMVHVHQGIDAGVLHLDFQATGSVDTTRSRNVIVLADHAKLTLIETYAGPDDCDYFAHHGFDIVLGAQAELTHFRLERDGARAFHLSDTHVQQNAGSVYNQVAVALGARLTRQDLGIVLKGEGANTKIAAAYLANGKRHVDLTGSIDHAAPHCTSEQTVKGVVGDSARGIFQGKVIVRPGAQKTDAKQLTKALVLSESAEIDHKPELEIYADDVKCAHGATAGDLDPNSLFYLQSRGIPMEEARQLLIRAFLADALDGITHELFQAAALESLDHHLSRMGV
jgi:Fe-S cluster assembly protein SufD